MEFKQHLHSYTISRTVSRRASNIAPPWQPAWYNTYSGEFISHKIWPKMWPKYMAQIYGPKYGPKYGSKTAVLVTYGSGLCGALRNYIEMADLSTENADKKRPFQHKFSAILRLVRSSYRYHSSRPCRCAAPCRATCFHATASSLLRQ